jgi:hypothetical protein
MTEETEHKINWTPIIVVGAAGVGIYFILKLLISGSAANQEQARLIIADWQQEFDELKTYTETIYAGGRTPTDQEIAVLSSMLDQMSIKEQTVNQLSKSGFTQLMDVIKTAAANWWLVPVEVAAISFTPIAGYLTYKLVRRWFNNRRPPPNFPCPTGDGFVAGSEAELKNHMDRVHPPTIAHAVDAQQAFSQISPWVQNAVAVESYYATTFTTWNRWNLSSIKNLNWALASAWVYGIGSASELILLRTVLTLLLI